ncbi:MAG: hypothetical protein ACI4V7_00995 [Succinivibrionaceae bacterium]
MTQDIDVGKLAEQINDKADRDLRNTVPNVWNNTLNTSQITNCITEIPQDIKLELKDGVLTLKAGSKIYIPNGFEADGTTKKFDELVIASDMTGINNLDMKTTGTTFIRYENGILMNDWLVSTFSSGSDSSSVTGWYYNVAKNELKYYHSGVAQDHIVGFPLGVATLSEGVVTSIDQVFNDFGYIGSTIFALPGVKGLIPNGRNEDGSLKNTETITNNVLTYTNPDTPTGNYYIQLRSNFISRAYANPSSWRYDEERNIILWNNTAKQEVLFAGNLVLSSGRVESLTPKTTFHALDYNDKAEISGLGMPSNRYIDLTLGASGASYIAPANGWFWLSKKSSAANQYMNIGNNISGYVQNYSSGASDVMNLMRPARKGETVFIYYNVAGSTNYFKFVYAEGEN